MRHGETIFQQRPGTLIDNDIDSKIEDELSIYLEERIINMDNDVIQQDEEEYEQYNNENKDIVEQDYITKISGDSDTNT